MVGLQEYVENCNKDGWEIDLLPVSESTQITRKQQIKGLQAFRSLQELDPQTVPKFRIYRRKKDIKIRSSAYSC